MCESRNIRGLQRGFSPAVLVLSGFFWALPAAAHTACAGLSNGAIPARFSEAFSACGTGTAADSAPAAVVDLPRDTSITYAAPVHRAASRRGVRNGRLRASGGSSDAIVRVSQRYRIDPLLLHSIVARESNFRPGAVSSKGALGLMQVMPGTARSLGISDPSRLLHDPELSLATGASYLKTLQNRFGNDVPAVLAAYNAGPGAVQRYGRAVPYGETRAYVAAIMTRYRNARRVTQ